MKISKELAKGSTGMLVLGVISKGDMYGYQIIKEISLLSEDVFTLNEGTLYPILHSQEKEGYLTCRWEESETGRKRKYYHLTNKGKKELIRQKEEWDAYQQAVVKVVGDLLYC